MNKTWTVEEFRDEFELLESHAMWGFVVARRRSDGKMGSIRYAGNPKVYYHFVEYKSQTSDL